MTHEARMMEKTGEMVGGPMWFIYRTGVGAL